jgi:pimeloyl-ACP methyl ester carboxylesterase
MQLLNTIYRDGKNNGGKGDGDTEVTDIASPSNQAQEIPLVLVHAFPVDHHMWDVCAGYIERIADQEHLPQFPIFAPDMPGAGLCPIPDATDSGPMDDAGAYRQGLDRLADAYVDMIRRAGYDKAVWVGLSMGGYVVLDVQRRHRETVAGIALCDTGSTQDADGGAARLKIAQTCEREQSVEPVMHFAMASDKDSTVKQRPETIELFTRWIRSQRPDGVAWRQRMSAGRPDLSDQLPLITAPAAVISGDLDPSSPPSKMKPLADAMTNTTVEFTRISDCGHFSAVEHPQSVARALVDVMRRAIGY